MEVSDLISANYTKIDWQRYNLVLVLLTRLKNVIDVYTKGLLLNQAFQMTSKSGSTKQHAFNFLPGLLSWGW